ncbi:MAG: hypothetical protein OXB84_02255, partial [Halobacteriovoraceae bacterium]|nr:hypothetical protein [Halobacteriovoraceae bacterium]
MVCPDAESAERLHMIAHDLFPNFKIEFYPGLEDSPYGGMLPSESNLMIRLKVLDGLVSDKTPKIIISSMEALMLKVPPVGFLRDNSLEIEVNDTISPEKLAESLVGLGYSPSITVDEVGTFSKKGEIFDIYP